MAYLVILSDDNKGISDSVRKVSDTEGSTSPLMISTDKIKLMPDSDGDVLEVTDKDGNSLFKIDTINNKVIIGEGLVYDTEFWDDEKYPATAINPPGVVSDPTFDDTNIGWSYTVNDQLIIIAQMPHKWKEGSAINPHVHYKQTSSAPVGWRMVYRTYNNNALVPETFNNLDMDVVEFTYPGAGTFAQIQQANGFLDMTGNKISSFLEIKLQRIADSAPTNVTLTEFDIHYQIDSVGSILEYIK